MIWPADQALFAAAMVEVESRKKHLPAMIAAGDIARDDADADLLCWRTIATMLRHGNDPDKAGQVVNPLWQLDTAATWAQLDLAASRAMISLSARAESNPADAFLLKRRDAVQAIHALIVAHRVFWTRGRPMPAEAAKAA